jgi:hypothetical protein
MSTKTESEELKKAYLSIVGDYLKTFTSDAGRRVLKDMRAKYCNNVFDINPYQNAYRLGKMEAVKDIEAVLMLGKSPEKLADLFEQPEDENWDIFNNTL